MKKSLTIEFVTLFLTIFFVTGVSTAADKIIVIEMADGNHVTFRTTAEDTTVNNNTMTVHEKRKMTTTLTPEKRVVTFEMGESGRLISFPMTEKDMATEDDRRARMTALRIAETVLPKPKVVTYELAESGMNITFPVTETKEPMKTDLVTAGTAGAKTIK